jgi:hypothetical protein
MAHVHVFQCDTDPTLYGYTDSQNGKALLPGRNDLKWTYKREIVVSPDDGHSAVDTVDMLNNISRRGYHLFSTDRRDPLNLVGAIKPNFPTTAVSVT